MSASDFEQFPKVLKSKQKLITYTLSSFSLKFSNHQRSPYLHTPIHLQRYSPFVTVTRKNSS